jgi:antitoxin component of MazEF toxin-antitoxin module
MNTKNRKKAVKRSNIASRYKRKPGAGDEYKKRAAHLGKWNLIDRGADINQDITFSTKRSVALTTRIRPIGNSRGVILNNQLIEKAGLDPNMDIVIQAADGAIIIVQPKEHGVNTDLSTWDQQFKAAIKKGEKPEKDMFDAMENDFDSKEW